MNKVCISQGSAVIFRLVYKCSKIVVGMAVISAGPYANSLHLAPDIFPHNMSSLNFYRPDALPDAQPMVSKY